MAEFKSSNLIERMEKYGGLTDNAWDFIDACTDDWCVEEYHFADNEPIEYEIRYTLDGEFHSKDVRVIRTHYGDFTAMCALIEYEAECNTICNEYNRQRWQLEEVVNYLCEVIGDEEEAKQTLLRLAFVEDDLKKMGVIE